MPGLYRPLTTRCVQDAQILVLKLYWTRVLETKSEISTGAGPVFVIGGSRTGSELVRNILNSYSVIYLLPEMALVYPGYLHDDDDGALRYDDIGRRLPGKSRLNLHSALPVPNPFRPFFPRTPAPHRRSESRDAGRIIARSL